MLNAGVLYKNQRGIMRIERIESITGVRTPGELAFRIKFIKSMVEVLYHPFLFDGVPA